MRRIQLYFEDDMDDAVAAEAARRGISKAALVRELVRLWFPPKTSDPIDDVIGRGDADPVDDIDTAIHGHS